MALATVVYSTFTAGVASHELFGVKEDGATGEEALPYRCVCVGDGMDGWIGGGC